MNIISNTLINTTMRPNSTDDEHIWLEEFNRTWKFEGEYAKNNPTLWDPKGAQVEYEVESEDGHGPDAATDAWDALYPENTTRYLRPDKQKYLKISSEVKNVFVDPIPPTYISDIGTEYIALETILTGSSESGDIIDVDDKKIQYSNNLRTISIQFKDEVGIDCKQIGIYVGELPTKWDETEDNIIYYYDRTLNKPIQSKDWKNVLYNISVYSTSDDLYNIKFNLHEKYGTVVEGTGEIHVEDIFDVVEKLNEEKLSIIIWDLAGNASIFTFPENRFKVITTNDLNNIVPVNIVFTKIEPKNFYLEDGIDCNIVTNVIDPNEFLWEYENVAQLLETSVGAIDLNTYNADDNRDHNPLDGIREFVITNVTESGMVEVEAWVATGMDDDLDKVLKERTYNTATCGPWIYGEEGRKYHITPYVPKYLHGTEFADFVEYFQLYINTMYKSLDTNRHISGLEKIARIGNFNDINKLETSLLQNYSDEFGSEFNFNMESLQQMTDLFNLTGYNTRDLKDTIELIKYVFEQLPAYNVYKGTNIGIEMAIKMFGFVCKVINLWVQKEHEVEKNPEFFEEDSLVTFKNYFQTSRINVEFDTNEMNYITFISNIDAFINLIESIKPLHQILNKIKYIIQVEQDISFGYKLTPIEYETQEEEYEYTWKIDANCNNFYCIENMCKYNYNIGVTDLLLLEYKLAKETNSKLGCFNVLSTFFNSNYDKLYIQLEDHFVYDSGDSLINSYTYEFSRENIKARMNPGYLQLKFLNADATTCSSIVTNIKNIPSIYFNKLHSFNENLINLNKKRKKLLIKIKFKILPGTKFGESLIPGDNT